MDDEPFLRDYDPDAFDRPSVTVDLVLLGVRDGRLTALLLRRDRPPQSARWALPGGFVRIDESLDDAAARVLREKVGIDGAHLEQLHAFGAVERDPRMRIVTVAYLALLRGAAMTTASRNGAPVPGALVGDPLDVLDDEGRPMALAFDHRDILSLARDRLRVALEGSDMAYAFLPERFTLRALQEVHEAIRGVRLNKPAFRRRLLDRGRLVATGEREADASHRPAELFRLSELP